MRIVGQENEAGELTAWRSLVPLSRWDERVNITTYKEAKTGADHGVLRPRLPSSMSIPRVHCSLPKHSTCADPGYSWRLAAFFSPGDRLTTGGGGGEQEGLQQRALPLPVGFPL